MIVKVRTAKADTLTFNNLDEKVKTFASGAGLGGLAEGVFVDDVTDVGSFGDLIGGPTKLERESNTPEDELLNRLKFNALQNKAEVKQNFKIIRKKITIHVDFRTLKGH